MENLIVTPQAGWVQITLNRPNAKNALNTVLLAGLAEGDTVVVAAPREASNATGVGGNGADNSAARAGAAYTFSELSIAPPAPVAAGRRSR